MKYWESMLFNKEVPTIVFFAIICISGMLVFSAFTEPAHPNHGFEDGSWFDRWVYNPFMHFAGWVVDGLTGSSPLGQPACGSVGGDGTGGGGGF